MLKRISPVVFASLKKIFLAVVISEGVLSNVCRHCLLEAQFWRRGNVFVASNIFKIRIAYKRSWRHRQYRQALRGREILRRRRGLSENWEENVLVYEINIYNQKNVSTFRN